MKRVCIVGYGAVGPIHASAVSKTENAEVYAVCDVECDKRKRCREHYDVVEYDDYDKMLLDKHIDYVHICTPHFLHFDMITKALLAGKQVVCEKPVAISESEFSQLLKTEGAERVCVVFQNRFNACVQALKKLIDEESLGKVRTVKGNVTWCRTMDYYNQETWRGKKDTAAGGVLINQAVHTLDLFSYLVGQVQSVQAHKCNFSLPELDVEDTVIAQLCFESGVRGIFFATNAYGSNSAPEFEVVFDKGTVQYHDAKLYLNGNIIEEDLKATQGKSYWGSGHEILLKNLYDTNCSFTPYDAENTMYTMFAIYQSTECDGKEIVVKTNKRVHD